MAKLKKVVAAAAVSKIGNFVEYPKFDVDTEIPQRTYRSRTTGRTRWMVALKKGQKLTAEMNKLTTVENGVTFVHVNSENVSGQVQYGRLPGLDTEIIGFMNVKGTAKQVLDAKIARINEDLQAGIIDKAFADECIHDARLEFKKERGY